MANLTTTQANTAVKELLDPMIYESWEFNTNTLKLMKRSVPTEEVTSIGRYFVIQVTSNQSYIAQGTEGGAFPATGRYTDVRALVPYRSKFSRFGFTGDVEDLANIKTLQDSLKRTIKDTMESFDEKQNFFLFGSGDGVLGVVNSVSSNALTMYNSVTYGYGGRAVMANQQINAYDTTGVTKRVGDMNVVDVTRSTDVVNVTSAAASIVDTDVLCFLGSYGYETQGLKYHVADSGTWLGLSRTTYPSLKSLVHDAASASLDWDMIDIVELKASNIQGDSSMSDDYTLIMHKVQEKNLKIAARNSANVQFGANIGGTAKADLGIKMIGLNGKSVNLDSWCSPSDVWGLRLSDWAFEEVVPRQLYKHGDGNVFIQSLSAATTYADAKEGGVYSRSNVVCKKPFRQFRIKNVNFAIAETRTQRS